MSITWAKSYPFDLPNRSGLYAGGAFHPLPDAQLIARLEGRHAVLAVGSNGAPSQLERKFGKHLPDAEIPLLRAHLTDYDVVYCAHITAYGSIPATLAPSPGTTVSLFVTYLNDAELARMHETESRGDHYGFSELTEAELTLDHGVITPSITHYHYLHGGLNVAGRPAALAAIPAQGRSLPSLHQAEVLDLCRQRVAPDLTLDDFIAKTIASAEYRQSCTKQLHHNALKLL